MHEVIPIINFITSYVASYIWFRNHRVAALKNVWNGKFVIIIFHCYFLSPNFRPTIRSHTAADDIPLDFQTFLTTNFKPFLTPKRPHPRTSTTKQIETSLYILIYVSWFLLHSFVIHATNFTSFNSTNRCKTMFISTIQENMFQWW